MNRDHFSSKSENLSVCSLDPLFQVNDLLDQHSPRLASSVSRFYFISTKRVNIL